MSAPAPQRAAAPNPAAAARPQAGPARPHAPPARTWDEYRLQAARKLVASNPQLSHQGAVKQPLLAIPVLEVELKADGSVLAIKVLRQPTQARDTVQLAIEAVHRAAPFGDVSRLPRPWKFTETFLFNDDRRFKPRSLDD